MKALARKKKEAAPGAGAPWITTFADLMNLLLCFFVLLFSMSTVDAKKFEEIAAAMSNSFGVFDGGGTSIGTGQLISSGMTQMNDLSEYFNTMGQNSEQSNNQNEEQENPNENEGEGKEGTKEEEIKEALEKIKSEMDEVTTAMHDEVSDLTEQYNLGDYVELSIDPEFQFVQLTLKGSVLYDSGKSEIKDAAKPILTKVGDILKKFEGYSVEITGHTDNVPMNSSVYKDNNWLSSARALNASEYLIKSGGLDPATIKYSGRGEYEPISSNATAEGRAKNRRIEIKIYNEYSGK
ncbi:MAG: flagellar motor protein MotB [Mobilitalea sp.]